MEQWRMHWRSRKRCTLPHQGFLSNRFRIPRSAFPLGYVPKALPPSSRRRFAMARPCSLRARRSSKSEGGILTSDFADLSAKFRRKLRLRRIRRRTGRPKPAPKVRHTPGLSSQTKSDRLVAATEDAERQTPPDDGDCGLRWRPSQGAARASRRFHV